ncbi:MULTISPECIES: AraC family transcriptional regulator [Halanaerobiaceae]|nr:MULTISPECIES: AraC family transcriptional regulator [Halanaerobiaceae]
MNKGASEKMFNFLEIKALTGVSLLEAQMYDFTYKKHSHKEYAIAITRRGIQSFHCEGHLYKVSKNGIITINPGEVHDGYSELKSGLEYQIVYIDAEIINKTVREMYGNSFSYFHFNETVHYDNQLSYKLVDLFRAINEGNNNFLEVHTKFYDAIAGLLLRYGELSKNPVSIKKDNFLIKRACEYIDSNAHRNILLDDIAEEINLSPYYFSRLFRKTTGLTPHNYLNQRRVEIAKKIINKDISLSKVAVMAGFSDQSHMNRRFKERYGITPGQYKKAISD